MKARALSGDEPWVTAWDALRRRADDALERQGKFIPYVGGDPARFYRTLLPQAKAARDLALTWWITGDDRYATAANEIIARWVSARPLPGTTIPEDTDTLNKGMMIPRSIFPLIWAHDILAGKDAVPSDTSTAFIAWLPELLDPIEHGAQLWHENNFFDRQYYQNHQIGETMGLIAIAIATGDSDLLRHAVNSGEDERDFLDLLAGLILAPGDEVYYREPPGTAEPQAGEIIDRYRHFELAGHFGDYVTHPNRGTQYSLLSTSLLALSAQMLATNGLDLWDYVALGGETLRQPFEFYAPLYAANDSSLQGGFYAGETDRLGKGGDSRAIFELGAHHFPDSSAIASALIHPNRALEVSELLGSEILIFGASVDPRPE